MHFDLLANRPEHAETVAGWLCSEWGDGKPESKDRLADALRARMSVISLPMHLLALEGDHAVGFIALKLHEMDNYPEREYWLGSLYVPASERGRGIGGALIEELIRRSSAHAVTLLSLQTERLDGGFYCRYGWKAVERANSRGDEILVMERRIEQ